MKDTNRVCWTDSDPLIATNSSGFSGLSGGLRRPDQNFYFMGVMGYFWSSTEEEAGSDWVHAYMLEHEEADVEHDELSKESSLSVRCLKNV